jgi:hypothetical protein
MIADMTEVERYLFDTQGCVVFENVLDADEVRQLLAAIPRGPDGRILPAENKVTFRGFLGYDGPGFRELINHPKVDPVLRELLFCGIDPRPWNKQIYLDDPYGMVFRRGETGPWFHNGGVPYDPWSRYEVKDGKIFCGLTCAVWALTDVGPNDGGFWYIPGSHKANFPLPREIETYAKVPSIAVQPAMKAGSVLIFTEALTHGTKNWTADHERISLFYKYLPGYMPMFNRQPEAVMEKMTPAQQSYFKNSK